VDPQDYIYVADTGNNRVQKFDLKGNFISKWGSAGTGDGQMMGPVSVSVNDKGSVFVLELNNSRVQEFKIPPQ
jgi:DNA-binding beta-propeller fold protein YncE